MPEKTKWTCPGCDRRFLVTVGREPALCPHCDDAGDEAESWRCEHCGLLNPETLPACGGCGRFQDQPDVPIETSPVPHRSASRFPALRFLAGVFRTFAALLALGSLILFGQSGGNRWLLSAAALMLAVVYWAMAEGIRVALSMEANARRHRELGERSVAALERIAERCGTTSAVR